MPEARDGKAPGGLMGGSAFMPRFRNLKKDEKRNFIKGYCVHHQQRRRRQRPSSFAEYGEELQKKVDHYAGSCVSGSIFGERLARFENHVRINKNVNDAWGIPALHIEVKDGDNEFNMAKDAADTIEELFHAAGWELSRRPTTSIRRDTAFTKWAPAAWATIPRPACSTSGTRATTSRICSWWMAQLRHLRLAESDHDDSGALHARERLSGRRNEERQYRLRGCRAIM